MGLNEGIFGYFDGLAGSIFIQIEVVGTADKGQRRASKRSAIGLSKMASVAGYNSIFKGLACINRLNLACEDAVTGDRVKVLGFVDYLDLSKGRLSYGVEGLADAREAFGPLQLSSHIFQGCGGGSVGGLGA
jgi:hypothetical protein